MSEITKGNNSSIKKASVTVLMYNSPTERDLSVYEASTLYLKDVLSYSPNKRCEQSLKIYKR